MYVARAYIIILFVLLYDLWCARQTLINPNTVLMKKQLTLLFALFCLFSGSSWAQQFIQGNLQFTVTDVVDKTVTVSRAYDNISGDIVIPSKVTNGGVTYTVTSVASNAFYSTNIASITIPATVMLLGDRAFEGCGNLSRITIEDSENELSFTAGYYGIMYNANADKTMYIGRNLVPSENSAPFPNVTSVTFGDKVTTIRRNLFQNQYKLSRVTIGKGVKTIEKEAFRSCGTDESVEKMVVAIGENVTLIESDAFNGCDKLTSIVLPSTLKNIDGYAFAYTGLKSIAIPASVDSIGDRGFGDCHSLTNIRIEDKAEALKMTSGYYGTFNYCDADKTIFIGRNLSLSEISAPFINATNVEFGDKVTVINPKLFQWSAKLKSVKMGIGITDIGYEAFYDAGDDENVEEMIVDMGSNVTTIGTSAFEGCDKLLSVTLPNTLKTIYGAAFQTTGLGSIIIPASVDSLGDRAFGNSDNLSSIRIEDKAEPLKLTSGYYGTFAYSNADKTMYIGRDLKLSEVTSVASNVTNVEFSDFVTTINPKLFSGNTKLARVKMGNGITSIGYEAFFDSGDDETVDEMIVTMGKNVKTIGSQAFYSCEKLKKITLPSVLANIDGYAFAQSGLEAITIPASVDSIGDRGFGDCHSLASVRIEDKAEALKLRNGYYGTFAYSNADKTMYIGRDLELNEVNALATDVTSVVFSDFVTTINPKLFSSIDKLASVKMGSGITTIGYEAFYDTGDDENIEEMVVELGKNVTTIGSSAFYGCDNLKKVTLPSVLTNIDGYAFGDTGLTGITIPASVDSIGDRGFGDCKSLASIHIENGAKVLKLRNGFYGTFAYSDAEKSVYIGRNLQLNEETSLAPNVTSVVFSDNVTTLPAKLFSDNKLTKVTAPWLTPININANVFSSATYNTAKLSIPGGTTNAYKSHSVWRLFLNIEESSFFVTGTATQGGTLTFAGESVTNGTKKVLVERESDVVFKVKADENYDFTSLKVNGAAVPVENGTYTYPNLQSNIEVVATFTEKPKFDIVATATGGTVSLNGAAPSASQSIKVYRDTDVTLAFQPNENYRLKKITVNGTDVTAQVTNNTLKLENIQDTKTIVVTFEKYIFSVTISGAGVSVNNTTPHYGDNVTVTIDNDPDRTLVSLIVNGQDVTAQVVNGQYIIKNVTDDVTIEATFKSTKEFITLTGEYATFSCAQDLNFTSSNLRAYIASGFNKNTNQVLLVRVYDVPAGTGVFLVGEPGTTYKIPYTESVSYYVNLFQANLQKSTIYATTGDYTNYNFGEQDSYLGFYPIIDYMTLLAQTAYLQLPSSFVAAGVKVSIVFEEDIIDGIEDFRISETDETIYDLTGRRLGKTQKGINIVNSKKILVK